MNELFGEETSCLAQFASTHDHSWVTWVTRVKVTSGYGLWRRRLTLRWTKFGPISSQSWARCAASARRARPHQAESASHGSRCSIRWLLANDHVKTLVGLGLKEGFCFVVWVSVSLSYIYIYIQYWCIVDLRFWELQFCGGTSTSPILRPLHLAICSYP